MSTLHKIMNVVLATTSKKWRYRLLLTFFGLGNEYAEAIYEQIFVLKYHGGWSFTEAYSLPVGLRKWFLERLEKQFELEKKQHDEATRKIKKK